MRLSYQMRPTSTMNDVAHRRWSHIESSGDTDLAFTQSHTGANFPHLFWREDRMTPLLNTVDDVILLRAEKQMFWANTRRIITTMEDAPTVRNRAVMKFERDSMRTDIVPGIILDLAITEPGTTACPDPAGRPETTGDRTVAIDLCPESLDQRNSRPCRISTFTLTEPLRSRIGRAVHNLMTILTLPLSRATAAGGVATGSGAKPLTTPTRCGLELSTTVEA